ncbi:MAG: hypothetical protein HQM09_07820 [Candidatus Riflebacteria bacterium]|nr:hypothetical protein [Candidatus Riflebacteria bacterium]
MKNFLTELFQTGVTITLENGSLKIMPRQPQEVLMMVREHKAEIISILESQTKAAVPDEKNNPSVRIDDPAKIEAPTATQSEGVTARLVFETAMTLIGSLPTGSKEWLQLTEAWNRIDIADDSYPDELARVTVEVYRKLNPGYAPWFSKWEKANPATMISEVAA